MQYRLFWFIVMNGPMFYDRTAPGLFTALMRCTWPSDLPCDVDSHPLDQLQALFAVIFLDPTQ